MRIMILLCLLVTALTFTSGCADSGTDSPAIATVVNTICPIMGHEVTDDGGRAEFDGKTVGFCCPGCIDKWEALSDEEKTAKLANPSDSHDDHGDESEHEDTASGADGEDSEPDSDETSAADSSTE